MSLAPLPHLVVTCKKGAEPFGNGAQILPFAILRFWQWSASDLASNALRVVVAEFLVAQALGTADSLRPEWEAYDLRSASGATIEVKSAAYRVVRSSRRVPPPSARTSVALRAATLPRHRTAGNRPETSAQCA
jgi:hypothetical protein